MDQDWNQSSVVANSRGLTEREAARAEIIVTANEWRAKRNPLVKIWTRRHLNQAVCVVRRNKIVTSGMLEMAGFNGYK